MTAAEVIGNTACCAVIDPEFAALIPPLSNQEKQLLEASLVREGCRDPLVVWKQGGLLLDGHNRLDICTRLGIPFITRSVSLKNRDAARLWLFDNQLGRRNLTDIDRIALAAKREPLVKATVTKNRGRRTDLPQNSAEGSRAAETREVAAAAAGVSHDTFTKGKRILEQGTPELVDAVRNDEVSIHAAAQIAELPPDEQRGVILSGDFKNAAKSGANRRTTAPGNDEWGTPQEVIDAVRKVLGNIDVDPASNTWSQARVKAAHYYTKKRDGLQKAWTGRVFLNPPYSRGLIKQFVSKLIDEIANGNVTTAILLVNNETDSSWFQLAATKATAICFPKSRIRFLQHGAKRGSPLQGQALLHFGTDVEKFIEVFGEQGIVLTLRAVPAPANTTEAK